jgi:hypothetical protein
LANYEFALEHKEYFDEEGYFIFNINDNDLIDQVNADVEKLIATDGVKKNSKIYSYNDSPRIVESWKVSESCRKLSKHPTVYSALTFLYGSQPRPFSTINFIRSTNQPLHSDYVHFGTFPELRLAGTWIALEDINPDSGPLSIVPKSHRLPIFDYQADLGLQIPKSMSDLKGNYELYEAWIVERLAELGLNTYTPTLRKGDCIVWAANLVHGSPRCIDSSLSRKSQVTHWDFMDVEFHYNPNFSNRAENKLVRREPVYF